MQQRLHRKGNFMNYNLFLLASKATTKAVETLADDANPFSQVSAPIITLIDSALTPALGLVGAIGAIYCVLLGAKLAKAEEPQDQQKAKMALKNALIGFLLIFILLVALKVGMNAMGNWYGSFNK